MKTTTIETNEATQRMLHYATQLRDLLMSAASEGIQLAIQPVEDKPTMAKRQTKYRRHQVLVSVPNRLEHHFFNKPDFITATAAIGADDLGNPAIVGPYDRLYHMVAGAGSELYPIPQPVVFLEGPKATEGLPDDTAA